MYLEFSACLVCTQIIRKHTRSAAMEVDDAIDVKPPSLQRKSSAKKSSFVKRRIVDDDDNSMSEDDVVKREDDTKPVKIEDEGLGKSLKSIDMSDVFSAQGSDDEQTPKDEDEKPSIKPKRLTKLLPDATAEARKVFKEIPDSIYAAKNLGMNPFRDDANMVCECTYDPATSPREDACGEDCVNRQIFMECTPGECRCGAYCLNRRSVRLTLYHPVSPLDSKGKSMLMSKSSKLKTKVSVCRLGTLFPKATSSTNTLVRS